MLGWLYGPAAPPIFLLASRTGHLFWSASRTRGLTARVAENILDAKTTALGEEDLEANN